MLAAMRSAIADLLPDTCYILSPTSTPDGYGGVTQTWGTAGTATCRLDHVSGREIASGGAIQPFEGYTLSLPYDTTINESWRVVVSSVTYAVKSVNIGQSWQAVKRVQLERV